jgi:RHS repeat-associated protein
VFDNDTRLTHFGFRDYDASSGSWLSPEPLTQSPVYLRRMAQGGMSVPTYAYAANNPLRYVDANGLYFTVNSPNANAIWASLLRLVSNRQIGWAIEQMAADPNTEFQINEIPYENCGESGARTWQPYERNARGDLTIPIDFNLQRSNADLATYFPGRGHELWTLDLLLGHELGHANGMAYGALSHFEMGLDWERALRNQSPLRLDHEQGGQCVNRCRGQ